MTLPLGRVYGVFQGNLPMQAGDFYLDSTNENVTANGTSIASATPLNGQICHVMTAANASSPWSAVALPTWSLGLHIRIYNDTANSIQVFPNVAEATTTINDGAARAAIVQMPNSIGNYTAVVFNGMPEWHCPDGSSGYASGSTIPTVSFGMIAANVGGNQATGTAVTQVLSNVTAAGASYSITLPVSQPGMELLVHNISTQTLLVFPNAGGTTTEAINALAANASISMLTNTSCTFTCAANGQWYTTPRVPS
jgi:hypothetical protein